MGRPAPLPWMGPSHTTWSGEDEEARSWRMEGPSLLDLATPVAGKQPPGSGGRRPTPLLLGRWIQPSARPHCWRS